MQAWTPRLSRVEPGIDDREAKRRPSEGRRVDPAAVARRLSAVVQWPGALDVHERSWRLIAQTSEFDAWLIAWPSGGTVDLHDHGASVGALHVMRGSLVETIPWRDEAGRMALARTEIQAGVTLAFGAGHVHDVRNETAPQALSLHVYSPPLTSMAYYDYLDDRLMPRDAGWVVSRDLESSAARPA